MTAPDPPVGWADQGPDRRPDPHPDVPPDLAPPESAARIQAVTEAVWARSRAKFAAKAEHLDIAVRALVEGGLGEADRSAAAREAHNLAGTVGMFGLAQASEAARELEEILSVAEADPVARLRAAELAKTIVRDIDEAVPQATVEPAGDAPILLLVEPDADRRLAVAAAARQRGFAVQIATGSDLADDSATRVTPAAVLLSIAGGGLDQAALALIGRLSTGRAGPVVILSAERLTTADTAAAERLGVSAFVDPSTPPAAVADVLEAQLQRARESAPKVLVVDDDTVLLETLRAILTSEHFRVATLDQTLRFWEVLTAVNPDLLVLDIDMPDGSGIELCRLVRADPRFGALPVLVLSVHQDEDTVRKVYAAGADNFMPKPAHGADLVARLSSLLKRVRRTARGADTDPLTGLANRRSLARHFNSLPELVGDDGMVAVCVLEFDRAEHIDDHHGPAATETAVKQFADILRQRLDPNDVAARTGGAQFIVLMPGATDQQAVQRLSGILTRFDAGGSRMPDGTTLHVTASGGVALYPRDGTTLVQISGAADAALLGARRAGGNRALAAGSVAERGPAASDVDVTIVEDDEVLAELLRYALEGAGLRCSVIPDGHEAQRRLVSGHPTLSTRIVLLDLNLRPSGGIGLLRSIRESGALERLSVIALAARSSEADTRHALSEGAVDQIATPFSVPLLLAKLHRMLEEPTAVGVRGR